MPEVKLARAPQGSHQPLLNTNAASKPLDIGNAIGKFDTTSVRDKVRHWQTSGGGVLVTPDGTVADADEEAGKDAANSSSSRRLHAQGTSRRPEIVEPPASPATTPAPGFQIDTAPLKPAAVDRRPRGNRLDQDVHHATAPKKRVVSDGHWVKRKSPPKPPKEEKSPVADVQLAWVRPPLLPRLEPKPPSPTKLPKDIKVYAARPRKKSFHSSSDEARPITLRNQDDVFRITTPRSPRARPSGVERDLSDRDHRIKSDDDGSAIVTRPSRTRKLSASHQERTDTTVHGSRQKSRASSGGTLSSPEEAYKLRRVLKRRKSKDNVRPTEEAGGKRYSSNGKSPEINSDHETSRTRPNSHCRGKSVGAALGSTHERRHSDVKEHYIHSGRRKASYQEEIAKYAPAHRRSSARQRSPPMDDMNADYDAEMPEAGLPEAPRVFGSRVEAWLQGTPDPFASPDGKPTKRSKDSRRVFSFESSHGGVERNSSPVDTVSHKLNGDASSTPKDRKQRERVTSQTPSNGIDPEIKVEYSSTTSAPSLKRSGARRGSSSPTKGHTKQPSVTASVIESEVASSAVSSSVDASAFLPPDAPARHSTLGLPNRRLFQAAGNRLSTIASVETFNTKAQQAPPSISGVSEATEKPKEETQLLKVGAEEFALSEVSVARSKTNLSRRLTKHADLISVLSMPASQSKSLVSARSIRTHRSRLATATIGDLMRELSSDEKKYMRELRTLADGVILVLLKCVLSKSDAALAAGLYSRAPSSQDVANATKLIRELGVALTRLKTLHNRIPESDPDTFLNWAQSAHRIYSDYVKTWRLGFEDVVVNLATDDGTASTVSAARSGRGGAWDEGLPRNEDGYVVDGNGERVDVAFLLKRPLVRLKYLTKTLKGINIIKPSEKAGLLAQQFDDLMAAAKKRVNDEKARMEDEAAAAIDSSRARDPKSLGPLSGVKIDPLKCVKARDYFDMHLPHSSGQTIDCRIEFLLRDEPPGKGGSGDVLVCEVDDSGRWLLFPPIQLHRISARSGARQGEIVVMLRGFGTGAKEWQELLTLQNDDEDIGSEWVQLLGSKPIPPSISRKPSFSKSILSLPSSGQGSSLLSVSDKTESTMPSKGRTPSPMTIQVPIGEYVGARAKRWGDDTPGREIEGYRSSEVSPVTSPSEDRSLLSEKITDVEPHQWPWSDKHDKIRLWTDPGTARRGAGIPKNLSDATDLPSSGSPGLKRVKAARYRTGRGTDSVPQSPVESIRDGTEQSLSPSTYSRNSHPSRAATKVPVTEGFKVWMPSSSEMGTESDSSESEDLTESILSSSSIRPIVSQRPKKHTKASSVSAKDLPAIRKPHLGSVPSTPLPPKLDSQRVDLPSPVKIDQPASAPSKLQHNIAGPSSRSYKSDGPPPPPVHRTPSSTLKDIPAPQPTSTSQVKRRSSSPLKHEYQPSSASEGSEISDISDSDDEYSISSEASEDSLEDDDLF